MLVLEGIMPFLNPARFRETLAALARFDDRQLRWLGFLSMCGGLLLLYMVR